MIKCFLITLAFFPSIMFYSQVGIGTNSPKETLHVKGSLKLEHNSQGNGNVLRVYKDGSTAWKSTFKKQPVFGILTANGYAGTLLDTSKKYVKAYISLPPGKWIVKSNILIPVQGRFSSPNTAWVKSYFSDSSTSSAETIDYIPNSAAYVSGSVRGLPNEYGMLVGNVLIENRSTTNKNYYYWAFIEGIPTTSINVAGFADAVYGENKIYAIPFE